MNYHSDIKGLTKERQCTKQACLSRDARTYIQRISKLNHFSTLLKSITTYHNKQKFNFQLRTNASMPNRVTYVRISFFKKLFFLYSYSLNKEQLYFWHKD